MRPAIETSPQDTTWTHNAGDLPVPPAPAVPEPGAGALEPRR